ncbi:MAG: molybdenum cofactor biosynthesis protein MoaE [Nitrospinae bacterium]|nr:molybdenum cofactor biosynthesis protein MoaE [Nitrospinota bacterium]
MAVIQREEFDVNHQVRELMRKDARAGAVAVFVGTVKSPSKGMEITKLEFECYPSMAVKKLDELEREAKSKFGVLCCHIIHRIGEIQSGEPIVFVGASCVSRASAFDACEWLIDELKKRAPIWKKEFSADGSHWVEDHP